MRIFSFVLIACIIYFPSVGQSNISLPVPTGVFQIGTFTDEIQTSILDTFYNGDKKYIRLPLQCWYPAAIDTFNLSAKYSPLFPESDTIKTNSFYNKKITTALEKLPVIFFCIGRGMTKHEYTTAAEELASNGYVVVSFDMPYIGTTTLLDGRVIKASSRFKLPPGMITGPYEKVDSFFERASSLGASYVSSIIDYTKQQNEAFTSVLYRKIDLANMGIFGHSLGGRIAGQVIAENKLIKVYLSMEGIAPRILRMNGVQKPMAYMMSDGLAKNALSNYEQAIPKRKDDVYIIILKDFGHNSFTDYPVTANTSLNYKVQQEESVRITRKILVSFFDQYLKNNAKVEDVLLAEPLVEIRKYPKQ